MIFPGSRYQKTGTFNVTRPDGTMIQAVRLPLPGPPLVRGYYRRLDGQRLDVIANAFLSDATAFWRLCDANNAVVPDSLGARDLTGIPLVTG
jgi:hypothetical protein